MWSQRSPEMSFFWRTSCPKDYFHLSLNYLSKLIICSGTSYCYLTSSPPKSDLKKIMQIFSTFPLLPHLSLSQLVVLILKWRKSVSSMRNWFFRIQLFARQIIDRVLIRISWAPSPPHPSWVCFSLCLKIAEKWVSFFFFNFLYRN